jgi:CRISPR-associated protein Cas2
MMRFILVTYDIEDDRRRTKIHKLLEGYGSAVQFSVFECFISEEEYAEMRMRLQRLLDTNHPEDSVRYYVLCRVCVERVEIDGNRDFDIQSPFVIS